MKQKAASSTRFWNCQEEFRQLGVTHWEGLLESIVQIYRNCILSCLFQNLSWSTNDCYYLWMKFWMTRLFTVYMGHYFATQMQSNIDLNHKRKIFAVGRYTNNIYWWGKKGLLAFMLFFGCFWVPANLQPRRRVKRGGTTASSASPSG